MIISWAETVRVIQSLLWVITSCRDVTIFFYLRGYKLLKVFILHVELYTYTPIRRCSLSFLRVYRTTTEDWPCVLPYSIGLGNHWRDSNPRHLVWVSAVSSTHLSEVATFPICSLYFFKQELTNLLNGPHPPLPHQTIYMYFSTSLIFSPSSCVCLWIIRSFESSPSFYIFCFKSAKDPNDTRTMRKVYPHPCLFGSSTSKLYRLHHLRKYK